MRLIRNVGTDRVIDAIQPALQSAEALDLASPTLSLPLQLAPEAMAEQLSGTIERVTFHNDQNGYTVLKLRVSGHSEPVTVTGNFSSVSPGESVRLTGLWTSHPQFGDQFKASEYEITRPATIAGIQKYLGSGLIKGLGPVMAKR